MVLEFNIKFFFVATILSLTGGIVQRLGFWLFVHDQMSASLYAWFAAILSPVQLLCSVILPFAVMYITSRGISSEAIRSVILSTFLGCWIGGVIVLAINAYSIYSIVASFAFDHLFQIILGSMWEIFTTALSGIFFVCFAAILFAYYQKTARAQSETHVRESATDYIEEVLSKGSN